jgi:hypothetical protein
MSMTSSPVVLYRASDRVEANLLAHALASAGIRVDLAGGNSNLLYGEVGAAEALQTELWVRPEDLVEGRRVIERYQQQAPGDSTSRGEPWVCAGCGEANEPTFDVCWQCRQPRPV